MMSRQLWPICDGDHGVTMMDSSYPAFRVTGQSNVYDKRSNDLGVNSHSKFGVRISDWEA